MSDLRPEEMAALRWLDSRKHDDVRALAGLIAHRSLLEPLLKNIIATLQELDLVFTRHGPRLTPKGVKFLADHDKDAEKLKKWGAP